MTDKQALSQAYKILSPYSNRHRWEFNNNLVHLNFLVSRISKDKTIFDAGCGIGILALALTLPGYKVEGGDKYLFLPDNEFGIKDMQKLQNIWREHDLKITNKDILTDTIDKQYDVVISIATIEHQRHPKKFLQKLAGVVKDGGYIYVAAPNISHLLNRIRSLFGRSPLSGNLEDFFKQGESFTGHWREYTLDELRQMCEWCDLEIVEACNVQSMRPKLRVKSARTLYVNIFRLLSYIIPGARDTNLIFCKK